MCVYCVPHYVSFNSSHHMWSGESTRHFRKHFLSPPPVFCQYQAQFCNTYTAAVQCIRLPTVQIMLSMYVFNLQQNKVLIRVVIQVKISCKAMKVKRMPWFLYGICFHTCISKNVCINFVWGSHSNVTEIQVFWNAKVCHCTGRSRHFEESSYSEDEGNTVLYTYENYSPNNTVPNRSKLQYSPHKTFAMTLTLDLRYASTTDTVLIKDLL
jgi:hypothetical protein